MAGGGIQRGLTIGKTDDYCYNILADPVHIHDLQATILHCLGIDHTKLTYKFQGRYFRLTDVGGFVVEKVAGETRKVGWQKQVNDLIRALRDERNELCRKLALKD